MARFAFSIGTDHVDKDSNVRRSAVLGGHPEAIYRSRREFLAAAAVEWSAQPPAV
jgi:hypothetical protein